MICFPVRRRNMHTKTINFHQLQNKILHWGASVVGFGDVREGLAVEFQHMPNAISLAVKHPEGRGTYQCGSLVAYSNQYEDVDFILESVQKKITTMLKSKGWRTLAIPPDSAKPNGRFISRLYHLFPHKTAATCAGLGWIGKSGLLVNPEYGPRLSWATVLTDAPLEVSQTPYIEGKCGSCQRCVKACPASAIRDVIWRRRENPGLFINTDACSSYLNYSAKVFNKYICGLCIMSCPLGGK